MSKYTLISCESCKKEQTCFTSGRRESIFNNFDPLQDCLYGKKVEHPMNCVKNISLYRYTHWVSKDEFIEAGEICI